jgi:non-specific serine/threonine protein kinase
MSGSLNCLAIGARLAEFEIQSVIGEGGFGIVYLAFDHSLQRTVAVKEYMPASLAARGDDHSVSVRSKRNGEAFEAGLRSFINEARLLAQFDHPALVKVYRFWEQNSTAYMAMRYYEGQTFKTLVRNEPSVVDEAWLRRILKSILEALDALYKTNILHRDISPENIMIQPGGDAVLLDFGAARQIVTGMSQSLTVILKPGFAPVEQYADDENMRQGAWTDIYSLSAVMYSAITQKAPPAAVARMLNDPIVPLVDGDYAGFSAQFLAAIDRGMSVRPEERPQTIAEFALMLGIELSEHTATQPGPARALAPAAPGMRTTARAGARSSAAAGPATGASAAPGSATVVAAAPATDAPASPAVAAPGAGAAPDAAAAPHEAGAGATSADAPAARSTRSKARSERPRGSPAAASMPSASRPAADAHAGPASPGRVSTGAGAGGVSGPRVRRPALLGGVAAALVLLAAGLYAAGGNSPVAVHESAHVPAPEVTTASATSAPAAEAVEAPAAPVSASDDASTASAAVATAAPASAPVTQAAKPAAPPGGTVTLNILPWANVTVDGVAKGPTPPLKKLSLPEGQHQIKIENPNFPEHVVTITVGANKSATVKHDFSAH